MAARMWIDSINEGSSREKYQRGLALLIIFLCVYSASEILLNLNRPYWGDEEHFAATVRQFGTGITVDTIKHYDEMSTPLPFILYGTWARLFGSQTQTIRLLSLLLASLTYIALYHLVFSVFDDNRIALLTTVFVALNPYMLAFSIFVFTDMAAMLFLVLACISVRDNNPILFMISNAAALLCRQYLVFLAVAAAALYLMRLFWLNGKQRSNAVLMLAASAVSFLPLFVLFAIWQAPNPDNAIQQLYVGETFRFHPNSFTLYITLMFVYLLPVVLLNVRAFFSSRWAWITAIVLSPLYVLFPIQPSSVSVDANIDTVGVFHRVIRFLLGSRYEHWIFILSFLAGLVIALMIVKDVYVRWSRRDLGLPLFLGLSILSFLAIMPFSYLGWEKYFLPAIPITAIWTLAKSLHGVTDASNLMLESAIGPTLNT